MSESTVAVNILTTKKMGHFYQKVRRTQDGTTLPPLHPRPPLPPPPFTLTHKTSIIYQQLSKNMEIGCFS
ncbi:hypothetical protein [Candidatus Nitrosocosmicus sp. SS]|uniref:hypothetical protein n=1 Tax=Candidatus Nitrosocosmicus agrestis TaxID=2563600 RepID=UPI00122E28E2|nr:hypothetical protein [Candidatus Nitrosocosmicus sp. SS]KAA2279009.1 hypothetical protein F1Z66_14450 [Candidatus Nitrosocosmicus sp. SS]KAF0867588.1 hypothetical protein E5N71_14640 [Candidatus Nitrosocosmicus sp. SS]